MYKKIIVSLIATIVIILIFIGLWNVKNKSAINKGKVEDLYNENNEVLINNTLDISNESTSINNYNDEKEFYKNSLSLNNSVEDVTSNLEIKDLHFLVENDNGFICVYYLDEEGEKILYKETNITTEYLSDEDIDKLNAGIDVIGIEALNELLEDFE